MPVDTQLLMTFPLTPNQAQSNGAYAASPQGRPNETFTVTGATHNGLTTGLQPAATLTAVNDMATVKPWAYTIEVTGIDPPGYNGTFSVRNATPTTITYWLPTNPGPYNSGGQVTTPNVKEFDARICYPNEPLN